MDRLLMIVTLATLIKIDVVEVLLNWKGEGMYIENSFLNLLGVTERLTRIKDYKPYKYTKLYVQQKYKGIPKNIRETAPADIDEWMEMLEYKNKSKLIKRIGQWLNFQGRIPCKFIELIGTDINILNKVLNLDKDEYHAALILANKPKYFQYRLMATIYPAKRLPEGISEEEAILSAQRFLEELPISKKIAWINYSYLKSINITPTKSREFYWEPEMIVEKDMIWFKLESMPGTIRIG